LRLRKQILDAARDTAPVLLVGEVGTGKELVAVAIHRQGPRAEGPLVVVNCSAIPPGQFEAELFGLGPGALRGSERETPGLVEQADEGTLFLDEVGELPPACQAKLLDVLEGRGVRPVGSSVDRPVDAHVIAASTRDLDAEARADRFNKDLLALLHGSIIDVPALREHPEDIPYLVQYFLDRLAVECRRQVKVTPAALEKLRHADWPGNVRQLRAVLESAVVTATGDTLDVGALRLDAEKPPPRPPSLRLADVEEWAVQQALQRSQGDVDRAAHLLGISAAQLREKMGPAAVGAR
jgi:DNA-binding NtrC family response regulator